MPLLNDYVADDLGDL